MSLNVAVELFYGVEIDFSSTDKMDEDYEKGCSTESVFARHIIRELGDDVEEYSDDETLAEDYGLRILSAERSTYLAVESTVNEVRGNGTHKVDVSPPHAASLDLLHQALKAIGEVNANPRWLMVTDYS